MDGDRVPLLARGKFEKRENREVFLKIIDNMVAI
jgi:hypothetical protein